jgi:membrane protease YdiL (CAAX protease family)
MKKGFLAEALPSTQLLFAGLILIGSWIVFQIIGMLSGMLIFGLSIQEVANTFEIFKDPLSIAYLKYVQAYTSVGMFIVAAGITAWCIDYDWLKFLGLKEKPEFQISIMAVFFIIIILPFTNFLSYFNTNIHLPAFLSGVEDYFRNQEVKMSQIMESLLRPGGMGGLLVNLIVIAVIPSIGEELTFRGVIQKLFSRWFANPHWAIFLTAFLFSAMHFQFLSFLPRFFLGLVLGYLYYWSGSIWLTMLVHFVNNGIAVVYYNYYYGGTVGDYMEKVGTPENDAVYTLISLTAGFGLIYFIYRKYKNEGTNSSLQS